jgi:hypothetical protein
MWQDLFPLAWIAFSLLTAGFTCVIYASRIRKLTREIQNLKEAGNGSCGSLGGHLKTGQFVTVMQDKNSFYLAGYLSGKSNFVVPSSSPHLPTREGEIGRSNPSSLLDYT